MSDRRAARRQPAVGWQRHGGLTPSRSPKRGIDSHEGDGFTSSALAVFAAGALRPVVLRLPTADAGGLRGRHVWRGSANWPASWAARACCWSPTRGWRRPAIRSGPWRRCSDAGLDGLRLRRRRGEPDHAPRRGRRWRSPAQHEHRLARGRRRRQLDGLRQGDQLPADQRRQHGRLQGLRQGDPADAALHRRADHGRHRQRSPVLRPDRRREDAHENGLRRPQGGVPRRHPRPRGDRVAAGQGDGRHRHRRPVARAGVVRHHAGATRCRRCSRARRGGCWSRTSRRCCATRTTWKRAAAMQLGANFAGMAIENSMLGACHACANPADGPLRPDARHRHRHPAAARHPLQRCRGRRACTATWLIRRHCSTATRARLPRRWPGASRT